MASHQNGDRLEKSQSNYSGENLSRQMTISVSPEQYERLFFQPSPARGDLSKRLGNPTLLGLFGFLIPFQTTMFCLMGWSGADAASTVAVSGAFYFLGGIAMNLAGICEFILGNTFPMAVFIIYGSHWCQAAFSTDPAHNLVGVYGKEGALSMTYNSGAAFYNVSMCLVSFCFFLGSLRTNIPFAIAIFGLIPLFGLIAAANFHIGFHPTAAGVAHAGYLIQVAGGFGFVTALMGWYLAIITACASTGVPCPLPIFDLSTKIAPESKAAADERAGAGGSAVARAAHGSHA
ncbi:hypothetical protein LTR66_009061 [Elasticomyces elasticus]|nr:hypothetical protein LTR66_009061 [Elasticomyces elasticus]KAK4986731.1 hypothetical protein LTR50_005109 [Elasticomyces elasticus]